MTWYLATLHPEDADAVVVSSATHNIYSGAVLPFLTGLVPARTQKGFEDRDPAYYTTRDRDARRKIMYGDAPVAPQQLDYDEATKGTITKAELDDVGRTQVVAPGAPTMFGRQVPELLGSEPTQQAAALPPLDIRVPVLVVAGSKDIGYCAQPGAYPGGSDCTNGETLAAGEAPYLGRRVPSVDGYVLRDAGHNLNNAFNAPDYFNVVQRWLKEQAGGLA